MNNTKEEIYKHYVAPYTYVDTYKNQQVQVKMHTHSNHLISTKRFM